MISAGEGPKTLKFFFACGGQLFSRFSHSQLFHATLSVTRPVLIERGSRVRHETTTPRTPDVSESHPAPSPPPLEYTRPREAAATHTVLLAIMTTFMYFPWAGSGEEGGEEGAAARAAVGSELWDIGRGGVGGRSEE